jgi:hypothetical protein
MESKNKKPFLLHSQPAILKQLKTLNLKLIRAFNEQTSGEYK